MAEAVLTSFRSSLSPAITWVPPPQGLVRLSLLNGLLRVLTLGLYHFWGKTEVRQRIWSAVRIDGEPLEYRGTGSELLRGFLIVFVIILLPLGLVSFIVPLLVRGDLAGESLYNFGYLSVLLLLSGLGMHRARRYRLSRTCFRGIRGGLAGRSTPFALTYLWTMVLVPLTLGWILPLRAVVLQRALTDQMRFGNAAFTFTGRAGPLYKRFWAVWLSAIVLSVAALAVIGLIAGRTPQGNVTTVEQMGALQVAGVIGVAIAAYFVFALIRAWYSSRMMNYFAAETQFGGARFTLAATVPSLVWLTATNMAIQILSLGLLGPIVEARSMRYFVERLSIDGPVPWPIISQNPDALLKRGEGLAEAFNVDAF